MARPVERSCPLRGGPSPPKSSAGSVPPQACCPVSQGDKTSLDTCPASVHPVFLPLTALSLVSLLSLALGSRRGWSKEVSFRDLAKSGLPQVRGHPECLEQRSALRTRPQLTCAPCWTESWVPFPPVDTPSLGSFPSCLPAPAVPSGSPWLNLRLPIFLMLELPTAPLPSLVIRLLGCLTQPPGLLSYLNPKEPAFISSARALPKVLGLPVSLAPLRGCLNSAGNSSGPTGSLISPSPQTCSAHSSSLFCKRVFYPCC